LAATYVKKLPLASSLEGRIAPARSSRPKAIFSIPRSGLGLTRPRAPGRRIEDFIALMHIGRAQEVQAAVMMEGD